MRVFFPWLQVLLFLLGISTLVASRKITKRGVLSEINDGIGKNLDLPIEHHVGKTIPLEEEAPVGDLGEPTLHDCELMHPQFSVSSANTGVLSDIQSTNLRNYIDLGNVVQEHVNVVRQLGIPVPQKFPVTVERNIPVKVTHPVDVPVERPFSVPVPVEVPVKVFRDVPIYTERRIPVHVEVPVKVPIEVPYKVYHPKPVPVPIYQKVPIPVPKVWIVKKKVPVRIHTYLEPLIEYGNHAHHYRHHEQW